MSKIIKAAQLQVLVTTTEDIVYKSDQEPTSNSLKGTILEATKLIEDANREKNELINAAKSEAELIIEQGKLQAERLIEEAEAGITAEIEAAQKKAYAEGWELGHQEGYTAAQSQVISKTDDFFKTIELIVDQANLDRSNAIAKQEEDILKLALKVAEKIIKKEISTDQKWLVPIINQSISKLGIVEQITINLHPQDLAILDNEDIVTELVSDKIKLEADPTLGLGSCIISTESGAIDASLDTRLDQIRASLEEHVYAVE